MTRVMDNQMEKNMEDEMETGVYRDIGHISVPLGVFGGGGSL